MYGTPTKNTTMIQLWNYMCLQTGWFIVIYFQEDMGNPAISNKYIQTYSNKHGVLLVCVYIYCYILIVPSGKPT